jgi:histone H3/H4
MESTTSPGSGEAPKAQEGEKKISRRIEPSVRVFPSSSIRKVLELEMKESRSVERVSAEAVLVLHDVLLREGRKLAKRAIEYAQRDKRKTISPDDVKRAMADVLY